MASQFVDRSIVEGFDGCVLDGSHHAFGLALGPRTVGFGQPMLDSVFPTDATEDVREGQPGVTLELGELHAVVGEDGVDLVGHRPNQCFQEASGDQFRRSAIDAREDQLGCAVHSDIEVGLAILVAKFGDIDVEVADLVVLELLRLLTIGFGQLADSMPLKATMQRRAAQMRDHVLERDVYIVEWQPGLHPQSHDCGFLHWREHSAAPLPRSHWHVFHRLPLAPLQDRFLVDPVLFGEVRDRSLQSL